MGSAVAQVLPLAIGVVASPLPIIAVILILVGPSGRAKAMSFLAGWLAGILVVGLIGVLLVNQASGSSSDGYSTAGRWARAIVGAALLVLAVQQWRGRPRAADEPTQPKWMAALGGITPVRSAVLGVTFAAIKPKNLLLTLAAAGAISETGIPLAQELVVLGVFTVVATLGIAAPVLVSFTMGDRADAVLQGWGAWLTKHNAVVVAAVLVVIGVILLVQAAVG